MNIEEKAKRYDEAIRESSKIINHCAGGANIPECVSVKATIEQIFPELKESEDERIRKEIIETLKKEARDFPSSVIAEKSNSWIAWIEEQANHANFRNKIQVGDKVTKNEDGMLVNLSQLKRVAKKGEQNLANSEKTCKDEQKHTPKHKIGDTIYYNSFGDVKSMIITNVVEDSTDNPMYEDKNGNIVFEEDIIEYNTNWNEEDEKIRKALITFLADCATKGYKNAVECINWLKSIKDRVQPQSKQGCCECDEIDIQTAIEICKNAGYDLIANRLKSLRPQNKWKPSDEQINCLSGEIAYKERWESSYSLNILKELLSDLKKLKG